jgi:hypothetical protein
VTAQYPGGGEVIDYYNSYIGFAQYMSDCIDFCAGDNAQGAPNITCPFVIWLSPEDNYGGTDSCRLTHFFQTDLLINGTSEVGILVAFDPTGG